MNAVPLCPLVFVLLVVSINALVLDQANCPVPRVRTRWVDLSTQRQHWYLQALVLAKSNMETPYAGATKQVNTYDCFTTVHYYKGGLAGSNTVYAHGYQGFLAWHRRLLWQFESALREIVTAYNARLTSQGATTGYIDACICIPFWSWEDDYQKEKYCALWNSTGFGSAKAGCTSDGYFSGWKSSQTGSATSCLYRSFDFTNYPFSFGPAQLADCIANSNTFATFQNTLQGAAHGSIHMGVGGNSGTMAYMYSPDDPLFWCHHANVDRVWAAWQDCKDYETVPPTSVTNTMYTTSWAVGSKTYTVTTPMPYYFDQVATTHTYWRLNKTCTPRDMHSLGFPGNLGFDNMYFRYSLAPVIATMIAQYPVCKFGDSVNYAQNLNDQKRQVDSGSADNNTMEGGSDSDEPIYNGDTFNSEEYTGVQTQIKKRFGYHPLTNQLRYLCLYECSNQNKAPNRNYSIPTHFLEMNNLQRSDYTTICERAGYTNGYMTFALLEDAKYATVPLGQVWVLPIIIVLVVLFIIGGASVGVYFWYHQRRIARADSVDSDKYKRMLDDQDEVDQ